ncbi:DUF3558 family protein [Streptomyces lichenis]|uniref:DUF3558 domain-containing protein n=1 Tax=Streptomyces lichenis TaxID=2306967 RepID=A0ABT0I3Z3_9ACTN|nr:DUF3558 family protein [Streptomyces lichenis]MCK8676002.1 DUF3558 domain-containing protein [Streptomyces lichenis]
MRKVLVLPALVMLVLSAGCSSDTAGKGSSKPVAGKSAKPKPSVSGPIGARKQITSGRACSLLSEDELARLVGVAESERTDQDPVGSICSWAVSGSGPGDHTLTVFGDHFLMDGEPHTVAGLRARQNYKEDMRSCEVTVNTSGAADPTPVEDVSTERAIFVGYRDKRSTSRARLCQVADTVAEAYLRALPKA